MPSTISIFAILCRRWRFTFIVLVFLAVIYNLLAFVSMFAPNALTIGPKEATHDVPVPLLDLSSVPVASDEEIDWLALVGGLMTSIPARNWIVPSECGVACSFEVQYQAPALTCRELREGEITLQPYDTTLVNADGWVFYHAPNQSLSSFSWGRDQLEFNLSYVPVVSHSSDLIPVSVTQSSTAAGQSCHFEEKVYRATFTFADSSKFVSTTLVEDADVVPRCDWASTSLSQECRRYSDHAVRLADGYASPFYGSLVWRDAGVVSNVTGLYAIDPFIAFTNDTVDGTVSLRVQGDDLGASLEELFANVTLGSLLSFGQTQTAGVAIRDGSAWIYDTHVLWTIYTPALVLCLLSILYGLYCSINNRAPLTRQLSDFLGDIRADQKRSRARMNAAMESMPSDPFGSASEKKDESDRARQDEPANASGPRNTPSIPDGPLRVNMNMAHLLYEPAVPSTLIAHGGVPTTPSATGRFLSSCAVFY